MPPTLTPYESYIFRELKELYRLTDRPVKACMLADHLGRHKCYVQPVLKRLQERGLLARLHGANSGYTPCPDTPELATLTVEDWIIRHINRFVERTGHGVTQRRLAAYLGIPQSTASRHLVKLERAGKVAQPDGYHQGYVVVEDSR